MFGFIAPPCARCTSHAFPAWRGTFCGLARCLARDYGAPARLLVNRDATFLALLGLSIDPDPPHWQPATCCNPLATPFPVNDHHPAIRHAAAVSVCGLAAKLHDDATDEGPLRRTAARLAGTFSAPATDRAVARLNTTGFPTARVLEALGGQASLEVRSPLDADQPTAEAFGHITAHLGALMPIAAHAPALRQLGASLGSLVYWRDAFDDRARDQAKGRFNPYLRCPEAGIRQRIRQAWEDFTDSLNLLPLARHTALLESLRATTGQRHGRFLGTEIAEPEERKRRKRKRKKEDGSWCDCCDCCDCCSCPKCGRGGAGGKGGGADACCDCGPGDSGCCDCCPCDGCDCCPCH